ncbi:MULTISPECIES: RlmE family RNA methyltransferase [Terasakiella]|uniref:Ribosomal RNA large subunit methyltransferase E n=1 Tax=Terasakiella brassicae TaxID=1634917 RepID=A0A917BWN4_9PROT|nr:RlmE family RNA methyltransferase [Terasakiella brassicae]GGF59823.1 ribosomal RNA large subunit methyltransferase E [Terasakiella brassicae]
MSQSKKWKTVQAKRDKTVRVKTARGRKLSSTRWLQRQLNDPYVQEAHRKGYRSRAAFKLIELDDRFEFLKPGQKVVDLGCAPGGWTQVAAERIDAEKNPNGHVIGIDLQEVEEIPGATLLVGDFMDNDAPDRLKEVIGGPVDVVLSDMAASASGHPQTDHIRITALVEAAAYFAEEVLKPNGWFVAKVLAGGADADLLKQLKLQFQTVRHAKPPASRKDSSETYLVASGFRGKNTFSDAS